MKLWEHPRLMGALCAAAVLACAAMPAAFLAVTDAAYIGRVVPVADPYTAPTPTADPAPAGRPPSGQCHAAAG